MEPNFGLASLLLLPTASSQCMEGNVKSQVGWGLSQDGHLHPVSEIANVADHSIGEFMATLRRVRSIILCSEPWMGNVGDIVNLRAKVQSITAPEAA